MSELVLEVYEGVGQVRKVPLPDGASLSFGRTQACDVVLTAGGVSRLHFVVSCASGVATIENKSTTKAGTAVNGERIDGPTALAPGAEITAGEAVVVLNAAAAAAEPPAERPHRRKARRAASAEGPVEASERAPREQEAAPPADERGADEAAPADEEGAAPDEASEEEPQPRSLAQEFLLQRRRRRTVQLVGFVMLTGAAAALVFAAGRYVLEVRRQQAGQGAAGEVAVGGVTPAGGDPALDPEATELEPETEGEPAPFAAEPSSPAARKAWAELRRLGPAELAAGLERFADEHPADRRASDALFVADRLRRAERHGGERRQEAVGAVLRAEATRAADAKELQRAQTLLELLALLQPERAQDEAAQALRARLREEAATQAEALAEEVTGEAQRLGPVPALVSLLEGRERLRGLGADDELEALAARLQQQAIRELQARGGLPDLSGEATTVEKRAVDAALRFDLPLAWRELDLLLTLSLTEEARLRAHWLREQVRGLEALFAALQAATELPPEQRPTLTVRGDLRARLASTDGVHVVLQPIVAGSGEVRWPWTRVRAVQAQELFERLGERDLTLTFAKAFHAFRTGLFERGTAVLLRFAEEERLKPQVWSFYSLASGEPLPEGGFVVFEGRLVAPAERDRVLAARAAAKEQAKELASAAREERARRKLLLLLERALALMDEGYYHAGRAALAELAKRHADVPGVGDVARARFESPVLRRRDVRLSRQLGRNGPPANRLDLYILGDGFLLDERRQVQFDRYADSAARFLQLQDFYKEYDQYINYWAVNLASNEEGLSRDGEKKDTALGTAIQDGRHVVTDRGRVFALLERHWPGQHDRQAVCLGNDFATVATGGGGTVAVCKTMLEATPHEVGHAFGGLGDEYDQEPGPNPGPPRPYSGPPRVVAPNVVAAATAEEARAVAPWKAWLDPQGGGNWSQRPIDAFEGANRQPTGYWRPQRACVMRDVGSPFCAPCMEVMVRALYRHVRPIDQVWPAESELQAGRDTITFRVLVMKPATHPLFVHWRRKGPFAPERPETGDPEEQDEDGEGTRERQGGGAEEAEVPVKDVSGNLEVVQGLPVHFIKVNPRDLEPGRYEISAEVWDPTPWVRDEHRDEMRQTQRWTLDVPAR